MATLEARTCDHCGSLDLEVFDLKDKRDGINYPPLHPFCRCTTVAYFGEELTERWSKDPLTGRRKWVDGSMSYEEWRGKMTPEQAGAMAAVKNKRADRVQYDKYKTTLGNFMPPFAEFQKLKYNSDRSYNGNTYQDFKKILRDWKRWDKAEFPSDKSYDGHFTEHGHEFGSITKSQYLRKAQELLRMPIGGNFTGYETETRRVRYDIKNNYWALGNVTSGTVKTMFIPDDFDRKNKKQMYKGWYYDDNKARDLDKK